MKLTATQVKAEKPGPRARKVYDGKGLHLYLTPAGGKHWRMDYRFAGKPKMLSLGAYPALGLAEARAARDAAKALLARGLDPSEERKREKRETARRGDSDLFRTVAKEFRDKREREGVERDTLRKFDGMIGDMLPALGDRRISSITAPELLEVLRETEAEGHYHTARRMRSLAGRIFRYGVSTGRCERDIAHDLRDALITAEVENRAALFDPDEVGALMRAIRAYRGNPSTVLGLQVLAYSALRPGEVRRLRWTDVDEEAERIVIPKDRMKGKKNEHMVPLTPRLRELLGTAKPWSGRSELLFPARNGEELGPTTFSTALTRMGYGPGRHVPHGFRRTFSTTLHGEDWNSDWIEVQLAHKIPGVRGIYNAAKYLKWRRGMLASYGYWLDTCALGAPVDPVPLVNRG